MTFSWILFDADGTLFDYDHAEGEALEALWSDAGLPPRRDLLAVYRRINGALWKGLETGEVSAGEIKEERFRRLVDELGLAADPRQLSASYLDHLSRQTRLVAGAGELLDSLRRTRKLALITNGLSQVQRPRLERSPIGRHFDVLVISEEVGFAKPDGRIFAQALAMMGDPPKDEVLMVGDNLLADIEGARRFGLATCWLNPGGRESSGEIEPTFEVHDLGQLRQVLSGPAEPTEE